MHSRSIVFAKDLPGGVMVTSLTGHVVIAPKQQPVILRARSVWVIRRTCEEMNTRIQELYARNDESRYADSVLELGFGDFVRVTRRSGWAREIGRVLRGELDCWGL